MLITAGSTGDVGLLVVLSLMVGRVVATLPLLSLAIGVELPPSFGGINSVFFVALYVLGGVFIILAASWGLSVIISVRPFFGKKAIVYFFFLWCGEPGIRV